MIQDTIVKKLAITKKEERHYFQINVPRQAEKIVGVELSAFFNTVMNVNDNSQATDTWLGIKRNKVLGDVQLQTTCQPNFFYAAALVEQDANLRIMDFRKPANSHTDLLVPFFFTPQINYYWKSQQYTHGGRKELDEILIDDERTIYGCYTDMIGATVKQRINYTVTIYIWFQLKD